MWLLLPLLTLALIVGIVIGGVGGASVAAPALLAWIVASIATLGFGRGQRAGLLAMCATTLLGIVVATLPEEPVEIPLDEVVHCAVRVERTSLREDGWTITGKLVATRGSWHDDWDAHEQGTVVIHRAAGGWAPTYGDLLSVRASLALPNRALHEFAFDPVAYAQLRGIDASGSAESELILLSLGHGLRPAIDRLRVRLERSIVTRTGPREAGVLLAILTGDKSRLDPELRASFAANGAAHVLAVSGLHLGLICLALFGTLRRLFQRSAVVARWIGAERAAALVTLPATIGYVLLTGAPASAVRAGIMATIVLSAVILNKKSSGIHALCMAVFAMLVMNPSWLADVGFQLSVTATGSLILTVKRSTDSLFSWLVEGLRISAVASLATTPVLLWHFGATPVMSPLTNLVVVPPIAFLALPLAIVGTFLDVLRLPGAGWCLWAAAWSVRLSVTIASVGAPLLELSIVWGRPHALGLLGWSLLAVGSPGLGCTSRRAHVSVILLAASLCVWDVPTRSDDLLVHAIPVGQGDCTLVESPAGRMLIDAPGVRGRPGATASRAIVPYLQGRGIRRLDVVVVTHADLDHVGDAAAMIRWGMPDEVWLSAGQHAAAMSRALAAAEEVGATIRVLQLPLARVRGDSSLVALPGGPNLSRNDGGLVLRVCERAICALLTGDIEESREAMLVGAVPALRADYLKVPHHGSRTSSTPEFLDMVRPRVAVAHVGRGNRFGFPHSDIVARYDRRAIRFRRTDAGHAILWRTDGRRWWEPAAYRFRSR
ncbi:MAG: competence protein ComEC [Bradymonadia bacterium]|jgi:competence protein ComEC